jgi:hypothetical protein
MTDKKEQHQTNTRKEHTMKLIHAMLVLTLLALPLMATSSAASHPAAVGSITPSEYEEIDRLGENLTDAVASFEPLFKPLVVGPLAGDRVKPQEIALLARRWGRLTRRWRADYRKLMTL